MTTTNTPTLFVSRVNVANARDTSMMIVGAPAGPVLDGEIQTVEVVRLVMSHQTLREVAQLFAAKVLEIDGAKPTAPLGEPRRAFAAKTTAEPLDADDERLPAVTH